VTKCAVIVRYCQHSAIGISVLMSACHYIV